MLSLSAKIQTLMRDATAMCLSAVAKRSAGRRKGSNVLTYRDMPLCGTIGDGIESPRIESGLGKGKDFSRYAAFHSGSYVSFDCSPGVVRLFAIIRNGIVPQCMSELSALGFDAYLESWVGEKMDRVVLPEKQVLLFGESAIRGW